MRFLVFIIFIATALSLFGQDEGYYDYDAAIRNMDFKPRYGVFAGYGLNFSRSDFRSLPNVPSCCPQYTSGSGAGFLGGFLYSHPITDDMFIGGRLGFDMFRTNFTRIEDVNLIIDGSSYAGKFEHQVEANFSRLMMYPNVSYRLHKSLFVEAGVDLSLLLSQKYKQIEVIKEPSDRGTFDDGNRYRNNNSGDIENTNTFNAALRLGFFYEMPLKDDASLKIAPEVFYSYWLMPMVKDRSWNLHQIHLGISLKYSTPPPPPPPPVPPKAPPMPLPELPPPPPGLAASIKAVEVDSLGSETSNFSVKIEDFTSLSMRPLLNFIFFAENSAELPERYIKISPQDADVFTMKNVESTDALGTYYNVLNILGKRLKDNPNIDFTLIGTNSDNGVEKNNRELSLARANSVKNYFTNVWKIDEKRIKVVARDLPKENTDSDEEGADDENRRVEIVSNSPEIDEPVITGDTLRVLSNTRVRFYPNSTSPGGIKNWTLNIKQNNKTIKEFEGTGELPVSMDWDLSNSDSTSPHKAGNISYSLEVRDNLNQQYSTPPARIPVEQLTVDRKRLERREDKEFEYYRLILFDYASSNLKTEHRKVVDFIKNRITPLSTVVITGYTDRIGKEEVNMRISTSRARAVARRLNVSNAKVEGVGENQLLYKNDLPEARFYCRTVTITIETPVKE